MKAVLIRKYETCLSYALNRLTGVDILQYSHRADYMALRAKIEVSGEEINSVQPLNAGLLIIADKEWIREWNNVLITVDGKIVAYPEQNMNLHFIVVEYEGMTSDIHLADGMYQLRMRPLEEVLNVLISKENTVVKYLSIPKLINLLYEQRRQEQTEMGSTALASSGRSSESTDIR